MEKLMTLEEFCNVLQIARSTVYKNLCLKRYPFEAVKIGNRLRFRQSDVSSWIDSGCPYVDQESA